MLANPHPANMEIVCDTNGFICNFWRSVKADPDQTAYYADYPSIHQDLTARHKWLKLWGMQHSATLCDDPEWFDCKAAGWWVWGMSLWIGGEWCDLNQKNNVASRPFVVNKGGNGQGVGNVAGRPFVLNKGNSGRGVNAGDKSIAVSIKSGGKGVSVQTYDKRPLVKISGSGDGVSVQQRDQIPTVHEWSGGSGVSAQAMKDRRPLIEPSGGGVGVSVQGKDRIPLVQPSGSGVGVSTQVQAVTDKIPFVHNGGAGQGVSKQVKSLRLSDWFNDLANRLHNVIVLNRDWTSAVTPTILADTATSPEKTRAVFLDPPYRTKDREKNIYQSDTDGTSDDTAVKAFEWAVKHGKHENYRIAYCCSKNDFDVPDGWTVLERSFGGIRKEDRQHKTDIIMFSPYCHKEDLLI